MRPVLTIIAAFALSGVAFAEEKPGKPALAKTETLEGVVIEKRTNVKSYEAWNAPSDPYYALDIGDVTETYKSGEKTWQQARQRHVTLRPSSTVSTADLAGLKGKRVALRGRHTEGEPYKPSGHAEQFPMEPTLRTKPDGEPEIVGWRPANCGVGFVVEEIIKKDGEVSRKSSDAEDVMTRRVNIGESSAPPLAPQYDPTDRRVLALVAYFERHGIRLVPVRQNNWRVVAPDLGSNADATVSILSFSESATEPQMRLALTTINLAHKLNAPAHLAMAAWIGDKAEEFHRLFKEYDPTKDDDLR